MDFPRFATLLWTVLVVLTAATAALAVASPMDEIEVDMDEDAAENPCGNVYMVNQTQEIRIISKGTVPHGSCGVTVFANKKTDTHTCSGFCVTFRSASIATCNAKVKFTGIFFSKDIGDQVKVFDCRHTNTDPWCWSANSLVVQVIESFDYSYSWNQRLYEFDVDVSPRCQRIPEGSAPKSSGSESLKRRKEKEMKTYVEGIVVAVCLALIFLIILFASYCYYKHKAVDSGLFKAGPSMSGFRKKLSFGRQPQEAPRETYRQTEAVGRPSTIDEDEEMIVIGDSALQPLTADSGEYNKDDGVNEEDSKVPDGKPTKESDTHDKIEETSPADNKTDGHDATASSVPAVVVMESETPQSNETSEQGDPDA